MYDLSTSPRMPLKVARKAFELGVHNDCIAADDPCPACVEIGIQAFDFYYRHCRSEYELIYAVVSDLKEDILNARG